MLNQSSRLIGKALFICITFSCIHPLYAVDDVDGNLIFFNDNGGWCWYQDERAIVDNGKIILGSVAHSSGDGGSSRSGAMEVTTYDMVSGGTVRNFLHTIGADDHNTAAFIKRTDGRYLAVYATHNKNENMYWNISEPENSTVWGETQTTSVGANNTYSNVFYLADEERTYNFTRGRGYNPNCMISTDQGTTWSYGGRLIQDEGRPYLKYASNNVDVIHFINTEQHPRDFNNSIYHGYVKGGKVYNSQGQVLDDQLFDESGVSANEPTKVYQGGADNVAWTSDLHLDENDYPYAAFSVQMNSAGLPKGEGGDDHRYHYARWDGNQWIEHEIAYAGTRLYSGEDDYTGNIALDPNNPDIVYISTDADPETGEPLISDGDNKRHYELFKGETQDTGASWTWTPITENSTMDNIRPVVPIWNKDSTALLWMRGSYTTFTNYNTDIVGIIISPPVVSIGNNPVYQEYNPETTIISTRQGLRISVVSHSGEYTLKLTDIHGRKTGFFISSGSDTWNIASKEMTSGLYLLTVTTKANRYFRKIVFR